MLRNAIHLLFPSVSAAGLMLLSGCGGDPVSYYEVPHEEPPAATTAQAPAGSADTRLHWSKPAAWQEKPGSSMRLASYGYRAPDGSEVDISVTMFPDAAGGLLANVNRWRGQVGLEPVAEDQLETTATHADIADLHAWHVDLAGTPDGGEPTRILGAIIPLGGNSWFFKMMGPDEAVASQREAFQEWINSIHATAQANAGSEEAPAATMDDPHANVPGAPPLTGAAAAGGQMDPSAVPPPPAAAPIRYTVPEGWQEQPAGGFRVASFSIPNPDGQPADVSVITLSGPAGGELANVNRWRGQVGLPPLSPTELDAAATNLSTPAGPCRVFDLDGPDGRRILAAIIPNGSRTWFAKLTGESAHAGTQRDAFEAFLQSLQFER